ncbi:phage tail protein [Aquisediminimonas sediminicola]|uniref:phage tail protein n=1 Tax=Alteraquisediminimonas sediminicola TaxID=2676787 RepID=UPI001C8DA316|nr:phage tail protein [Aquisediminimonas sediminicola]
MATLVLTVVGTLVGGPIGGAIGGAIGQSIDRAVFAPKGRQGPRLGELSVQTSAYGTPLPRIFGRLRVAGTVIWATDLLETRQRSGGGKGKPKVTTYSYASSFAVALSARPIRAVRRIWADGKLLRGAAGDWKSDLSAFRLWRGDEGQRVDPLIAAYKGADAPAFRGLAVAVFENLQLADFGNRIPSLTFEVEADAGDVSLLTIAQSLSGGAVAGVSGGVVSGFAASGDSVRGALEGLVAAFGPTLADDGARLRLMAEDEAVWTIPTDDIGARALEARSDPMRVATEQAGAGTLPDGVGIAFYDPGRDFQAGLQQASRHGLALRSERVELPAALPAAQAKRVAETMLARLWRDRMTARVKLPWRWAFLRPGQRVVLPDFAGEWRIVERSVERGVVELTLVALGRPLPIDDAAADSGEAIANPDVVHGETVLVPIDMPMFDEAAPDVPRYWVATAGMSPGWRQAVLAASVDNKVSWTDLGLTAPPALIGSVEQVLAPGSALLMDRIHTINVAMLHEDMWLEAADDDALLAGRNLALVGDELIQFGAVQPLGNGRFRLSRLWRGRLGTEWAMAMHGAGERFVLIERDSLLAVEPGRAALNTSVALLASGIGDVTGPATADMLFRGRNVLPHAPVRLEAEERADGDLAVQWIRRDRTGFVWTDGVDVPMSEAVEAWQIQVMRGELVLRNVTTDVQGWIYDAALRQADGTMQGATFEIIVRQVGVFGPGQPGRVIIPA